MLARCPTRKTQGPKIAWNIILNGIQVTHLGDLGHFLKAAQMFQIGTPEILMINTGAATALAEDNIALLSSKIIIPMLYYTPGIDFPFYHLKTILDFTEGKDNVEHVRNINTYTRKDIPLPPSDTHSTKLPENRNKQSSLS